MTYGKSGTGNYAVALDNKIHGTWDAVEAVGDFYRLVDFDAIPEADWDRVDALEERVRSSRYGKGTASDGADSWRFDDKMKRTNIGSISSGTMRPEDLIPAFLYALEHQDKRTRAHYNLCRSINARIGNDDYYGSEDSDFDLEALCDALDSYAPEGFYFGSHPGNGSDYGFWLSEEGRI